MAADGASSRPEGPVHRAFGLLQLVVAADGPVGVRELARRSGMSSSTTGRTLGILADLGMIERTADGAALPGGGLATLTSTVSASGAVARDRLRPLTGDLVREFGENAAIGVDDGTSFLYLDSVRPPTALQVPDPAGHRFEFHLVAPGLVAMAEWPTERLDGYLAQPLERATEHSVVDPDAIRERLAMVRRQGFAWTHQELDLEVNGLAVPVRNASGDLVVVATLYGPSYRLDPSVTPDLGRVFAEFVAERTDLLLAHD